MSIKLYITFFLLGVAFTLHAAPKIKFPKIQPKNTHAKSIHSLALGANGRQLAFGMFGTIQLADDFHTPFSPSPLPGPSGKINALAFSPGGKTLFAAGGNAGISGEIKIYRLKDLRPIHTLVGHDDAIYSLAISPNGKQFATGSYDQQIILWNAQTGKPIRTFKGHNGAIFGLAFRRDGQVLASASADATVKLWHVPTGKRLDTLSQPLKAQNAVAFSPDSQTLIAGGADHRIRAWTISASAAEGTNPLHHSRFAHEGAILHLAWSPNGKTLLSTANNQTAKLWHAKTITPLRQLGKLTDWPTAAVLTDTIAYITQRNGQLKHFPVKK